MKTTEDAAPQADLRETWRCLLLAPGLVEAPVKEAAVALGEFLNAATQNAPAWQSMGGPRLGDVISYTVRRGGSDLAAAFRQLDPLAQPKPTKFLLLGTRSDWTVLLSNLFRGDAGGAREMGVSRVLRTRALKIVSSDDRSERVSQMFHLYDGGEEKRILEVVQEEDGKYRFRNEGRPLPFEKREMFKRTRVRDRFTRDMLLSYLAALGAHPYDESFYAVNGRRPAYLVERIDKDPEIKSRFVFTPLAQANNCV